MTLTSQSDFPDHGIPHSMHAKRNTDETEYGWRGSGGRVVRALTPAALHSTLCWVVGSSPIAARSRGLLHHRGLSVTVICLTWKWNKRDYGRRMADWSTRPKMQIVLLLNTAGLDSWSQLRNPPMVSKAPAVIIFPGIIKLRLVLWKYKKKTFSNILSAES